MRTHFRFLFMFFLGCALLGVLGVARATEQATDQQLIDPEAVAVLEKSCAHLAGLQGYSFRAEVLLDLVYQHAAKIQIARNMEVVVRRPNAFRVEATGDDIIATSVFDGKTFTLALAESKAYGQLQADMDSGALLDLLAEQYGLESPLGDLLRPEACARMSYASASYLGKGFVGDIQCHHLFFQGTDIDWQIWIEDGPTPFPRKVLITEKQIPLAPQFTAFLRNWEIAVPAASSFDYAPPEGFSLDKDLFTSLNRKQ